jgi:hypothetical protein
MVPRKAAFLLAAVALGALAAPFVGPAPSVASSPTTQSAIAEAVCPAPTPGTAQCFALRRTDIAARSASAVSPQTPPTGYGPADLQSAYALPTGSAGSGLTVAIVDAYDLPTAEADLGVYRTQFGLPPCTTANGCFRKVNQNGATSPLPVGASWADEIALDMDMVSATCPNCKILLVEATDSGFANLGVSVNTAVSMGAIAVSNSYGAPEFSGQTSYDSYYNHPGVAITVSTADCGYGCSGMYVGDSWPSASPNVVAVGGTSLAHDTSTRGWTESAWGVVGRGGAGSGCSLYESKPSWQHDSGCANRTQADVSAVADPATGVAVYSSDPSVNGWQVYGGTSASSPIIAAAFALAGHLAAGTYPASYLYADTADLYDVTSGSNDIWEPTIVCTVFYLCHGVVGYDGPTGLGTPNGVHAFTAPTVPGKPTNLVAVAGNKKVGLTWTAPADNGGSTITGYTVTSAPGSKTCTWTSGPLSCTVTGLTSGQSYTFTVTATNGVGTGPASDPSAGVTPFAGATYHPLTPTRILDSRSNTGFTGPLSPEVAKTFQVTGVGGVPAGATAVTGNLTVTAQTAFGYLYIGPVAMNNPTSSTLNFPTGDDRANAVTVALSSTGSLSVTYVDPWTSQSAQAIFDVTGYFTPDNSGATYHPLAPTRLLDSRNGTGLSGVFNAWSARTFAVTGVGGVPAGATAVTGNLTVTDQSASGYLYMGPTAMNVPTSSTLNFPINDNRANAVTVALSSSGTLSVTYVSATGGATTDVVFDVTGFFTPDMSGAVYVPLNPARILDSRSNTGFTGPLATSVAETFAVTGQGGVPSGATAVTGNLTVTAQTAPGYLYIGPVAMNNPVSSTLNFPTGDDRANAVTVALSSTGTLSVTYVDPWSGQSAQAIFDVTGYFVP